MLQSARNGPTFDRDQIRQQKNYGADIDDGFASEATELSEAIELETDPFNELSEYFLRLVA